MNAIQHQAARRGENFPVASYLLPEQAREPVLAFYDFARGADDIADAPGQSDQARYDALNQLVAALHEQKEESLPSWSLAYMHWVKSGTIAPQFGLELLQAFLQDTQKHRYEDLDELLEYCRYSANPVGRMVLHVCSETRADLNASDAICTVLQLLNHIQDLKADAQQLDRIYLPQEWMRKCTASNDMLFASRISPPLRKVVHQLLDVCDDLLVLGAKLPPTIDHYRVRAEICIILQIAKALSKKLRKADPLKHKVRLTKVSLGMAMIKGIAKSLQSGKTIT